MYFNGKGFVFPIEVSTHYKSGGLSINPLPTPECGLNLFDTIELIPIDHHFVVWIDWINSFAILWTDREFVSSSDNCFNQIILTFILAKEMAISLMTSSNWI